MKFVSLNNVGLFILALFFFGCKTNSGSECFSKTPLLIQTEDTGIRHKLGNLYGIADWGPIPEGENDFQLRIWYSSGIFSDTTQVVSLARNKTDWTAYVKYFLPILDSGGNWTERYISGAKNNIFPKSGWEVILPKLCNMDIQNLGVKEDIEGAEMYKNVTDLTGYRVEFGTKESYRTYYVINPVDYQGIPQSDRDKFVDILKLIEAEFNLPKSLDKR